MQRPHHCYLFEHYFTSRDAACNNIISYISPNKIKIHVVVGSLFNFKLSWLRSSVGLIIAVWLNLESTAKIFALVLY